MSISRALQALRAGASVAALATVASLAPVANAQRVVHLAGEFTTSGAPAPGWSYLWNSAGPIGQSGNYTELFRDQNGAWETVANGQYPDAMPGNGLRISPFIGAINRVEVVPGSAAIQQTGANTFDRHAIIAYTIQASDIAAAGLQPGQGANAVMDTYEFATAATGDGINSIIYVNDLQVVASPLPPGLFYNQNSPGAFPVPLTDPSDPSSLLHAGDTIYIAISPGFLPTSTDVGDSLRMDFKVTITPEPAMLSVLALAGVMLTGRRRVRT